MNEETNEETNTILLKPEYQWMNADAIVEQLTNEEVRILFAETGALRERTSTSAPPAKLSELIELIIKNEKPRFNYYMETIDHVYDLLKSEILFRFKNHKL